MKRGPALLVLLAAGLVAAWLLLPVQAWIEAFSAWVAGMGAWGVLAYGAAYAGALVLMVPAAPFTIGAGFIFGLWGFPVALVSATLGASLAFLVSRYAVRDRVARAIATRPKLRAVDGAVAQEGWRVVALLRLSPLVPFNLQNYALGASRIGFWPYTLATGAGIAPGCLLYVYFGAAGRTSGGPLAWAFLAFGLIATVAVTVLVGRKARAALARQGVDAS